MGKTAGQIKNPANSLLRNPMMLHPDRDQKLQILPLEEYTGDERNVNRVKWEVHGKSRLVYLVMLESCTKEKKAEKRLVAFK